MLNDPLSVTYNGTAQSLARVSDTSGPVVKAWLGRTAFRTADGEFKVFITKNRTDDGCFRVEVLLERTQSDSDPFNGITRTPNRVGLVFEVNSLKYNTDVDIDRLRSALDAFVDPTIQSRLIAGEC